jgi:hypothetical protein
MPAAIASVPTKGSMRIGRCGSVPGSLPSNLKLCSISSRIFDENFSFGGLTPRHAGYD